MRRPVTHIVLLIPMILSLASDPLSAQTKPDALSSDDVERYFETRDARVYYSWIVRAMMEATSASRPVAQGYAFLVGNMESIG